MTYKKLAEYLLASKFCVFDADHKMDDGEHEAYERAKSLDPLVIGKDGTAIMASWADFKNLQESPAGFGDTEIEAVADLLQRTFKELEPPTC